MRRESVRERMREGARERERWRERVSKRERRGMSGCRMCNLKYGNFK